MTSGCFLLNYVSSPSFFPLLNLPTPERNKGGKGKQGCQIHSILEERLLRAGPAGTLWLTVCSECSGRQWEGLPQPCSPGHRAGQEYMIFPVSKNYPLATAQQAGPEEWQKRGRSAFLTCQEVKRNLCIRLAFTKQLLCARPSVKYWGYNVNRTQLYPEKVRCSWRGSFLCPEGNWDITSFPKGSAKDLAQDLKCHY